MRVEQVQQFKKQVFNEVESFINFEKIDLFLCFFKNLQFFFYSVEYRSIKKSI